MVLQQQPTKTSCGPTCVAMLARVPVSEVLAQVKLVRTAKRARKRTHNTNVGELARLLKAWGLVMGRRITKEPTPVTGRAVLRIERSKGANWHWAVLVDGTIYDPARPAPIPRADEWRKLSWYEVEGGR